jgi:hypothetical protein
MTIEGVYTLFDDESTRKNHIVMSKWEIMMDDSRNPEIDMTEIVEKFVQFGGKYRIIISLEELK